MKGESHNSVLANLEKTNPNWRKQFENQADSSNVATNSSVSDKNEIFTVDSPSDWNESMIGYIVDTLMDQYMIGIGSSYLLAMLILIFTVKFLYFSYTSY